MSDRQYYIDYITSYSEYKADDLYELTEDELIHLVRNTKEKLTKRILGGLLYAGNTCVAAGRIQ